MDNVRIAILTTGDKVCAFMDNSSTKALHYYNDELHSYLEGSANTFSFSASARHEDSQYLVEGGKLSFRYRDRDYYFNIVKVYRTEYVVEVTAYGLVFELLNEDAPEYKAAKAMSFEEYLNVFDAEKTIKLGINEVSDKKITNEWTGTSTILARLYSLANVFSAEVEFVPELNKDHSLKRLVMNVYREHGGEYQGIGQKRRDVTLRYGVNISGVKKTSDITELYTAIYPVGKDGLTVASLNKQELDENGSVEFSSPSGDGCIRAVQARDRFPSNLLGNDTSDRYILKRWSYDTDNANTLYGQALAELKKICEPDVKYEVDGYFDTDIGDTVNIADEEYIPPLYLEARVTEQVRSFTDPARNKTTFDNFVELNSEISEDLLKRMEALIAENKAYACMISTDNGIVFKNSTGSTTLTANVRDAGADVTDDFTIQWKKDGVGLAAGKTIIVNASDVDVKSVYRFEAVDAQEKIRGSYEVTVTDVSDGKDGKDGINGLSAYEVAVKNGFAGSVEEWLLSLIGKDGKDGIPGDPGKDGKTPYLHIAYANSADGKTGFDVSDATNKTYIGQYTDFTQADSTDPTKYSWTKIKGDKGDKGDMGSQGLNLIRGTNTADKLTETGIWEDGTWRSASTNTGLRTSIAITDAPNPNIKLGWEISQTNSSASDIAQDYVPVVYGQKYTMSCYARWVSGTPRLRLQIWKSSTDCHLYTKVLTEDDSDWKRYSFTFIHDFVNFKDNANIYFGNSGNGTLQICGMKLENGEVDADEIIWVPAIEDLKGEPGENGTQGINILRNSGDYKGWLRSSASRVTVDGEVTTISMSGATANTCHYIANWLGTGVYEDIKGKPVTISFEIKSDDWSAVNEGEGVNQGLAGVGIQPFRAAKPPGSSSFLIERYRLIRLSNASYIRESSVVDGKWTRVVTKAITIDESFWSMGEDNGGQYVALMFQLRRNGTVSVRHMKVEYGDVPDPVWTPAIEDLEGVGISDITNKYAVSSSNTTPPATWSESVPTMTTANKYLWNYEIIAYTDGTTSETAKRVIGVYGDTGGAGKGIKSITEYYLASANSSGVTTTTSGWTTSIQTTTGTKKYLWNYEVVTFTDNTTHTSTPVIIGTHGTDGQDGERGTGILKITTAPTAYTTATNGITPAYRIALSTVLSQTGVAEVLTGDILEYSYYHYPVLMVYSSYVYCGARTSIRGAAGTAGANGTNGKDGENGKMLYGTCATAAGTAAKTVACAEAKSLYAGLTVLAEFSAANTASAPTLNVNSLGAKQIYINGAVTGSSNLFLWGAGAKIQFTYNGTYWIPVGHPCAYYGTSSTAAATAAKTSAIAGIVVCKGTTVGIKFTYANSAVSPTLNLSSVGAKAVYTQGVACAYWQAGATVSFTFDGTYWRVSSEPVYASEVVVGNAAAKNVHIDSEGVDIRNGNTDVASFGEDLIELGKNSDAAAIEMCKGVCEIALNDDCLNILLKKTYTKMLIGIMNQAAGAPDPFIEFCGGEASSNMCFSSGLSGSIYLHEIARMVKNTPVFIQGTKVVTGTGTNYVTMLTNAQVLAELQKREITPADGWENYVTIIAINGDGVANGTPLTGVEYWGGSYNSWYAYFAASISGAYRINYTIIYDQNHGKAVL